MKILIKGAGDLATGIAVRLHHCGYPILMTEIEEPLTVRRMVAFSRAVYEGEAVVEGITGVRVQTPEEIRKAQQAGKIPVLVDPHAAIRTAYQPDVLIDAILAKKNSGNRSDGRAVCDRRRTGIYGRRRLSLCHRNKTRTYIGKRDLSRFGNSEYRGSGRCGWLYDRAAAEIDVGRCDGTGRVDR